METIAVDDDRSEVVLCPSHHEELVAQLLPWRARSEG